MIILASCLFVFLLEVATESTQSSEGSSQLYLVISKKIVLV
jgi:hypothetical protein